VDVVPHNKNAHHVHFVRATHDRLSGLFADKCVAAYMPPPDYDTVDVQMADRRAVTPEGSMATESVFDGYDTNPYGSSRKRRRLMEDPQVQAENMHQLWAEELLDYFMLQGEADAPSTVPLPPEGANLDRAIDDKGHTALHWAVAMGDLEIVKRLLTDRASIDVQSKSGETPLMRSVLFTNIFEKQNMERIASLLVRTVNMQDWAGSTVFHHIANTTVSRKKYACARYYMDCILNKMAEVLSPDQIERILNEQDHQGDTAITIAARNGARKCVRSLIGRNAAVDIPNHVNITADQLIVQLNNRRQERARQLSSSPFQSADLANMGGAVQQMGAIPFDPLVPRTSLEGSDDAEDIVFKSEPALKLAAHIAPCLTSKIRQLASAIDAEIMEKDAELFEAQRVVTMREAELEQLQRQAEEMRVRELKQTGAESEADLQAQLDAVELECIALLEEEQKRNLDSLYQSPVSDIPAGPPDDSLDEESLLQLQLRYAREILVMKEERQELVRDVTGHLARAGLGEGKQQQYKRLITGALGVREEELEGLLPEIVEELEIGKGLEGIGV
jgi:transcription factor MBP1